MTGVTTYVFSGDGKCEIRFGAEKAGDHTLRGHYALRGSSNPYALELSGDRSPDPAVQPLVFENPVMVKRVSISRDKLSFEDGSLGVVVFVRPKK